MFRSEMRQSTILVVVAASSEATSSCAAKLSRCSGRRLLGGHGSCQHMLYESTTLSNCLMHLVPRAIALSSHLSAHDPFSAFQMQTILRHWQWLRSRRAPPANVIQDAPCMHMLLRNGLPCHALTHFQHVLCCSAITGPLRPWKSNSCS